MHHIDQMLTIQSKLLGFELKATIYDTILEVHVKPTLSKAYY